jgi:hypothetical protein
VGCDVLTDAAGPSFSQNITNLSLQKQTFFYKRKINKLRKFSTVDILVPIPMKNAAKCDKQCELQNPASHQIFERKWRWLVQHVYFSVPGIKQLNAIEVRFTARISR